MARQVLDLLPERAEGLHDWLMEVDADLAQVALQRFFRVDELEMVHHLGEAIDVGRLHRQDLADLACRAPAAIGDHVGGHRGAEFSVLLVDVLDHALAAVPARKVDVDIGPLAALLREEAFEEQIHSDRVHGGDPEAVADGAVGGGPASLHEDVLLPAEVHDVPDDQEVAGEIEFLDEVQLALDLAARAVVVGAIALACPRLRDLPQERRHRFPRRHGVLGKAVAEIRHRVFDAVREVARAGQRVRQIREQPRHCFRRLEKTLRVARQPPPRLRQRRLVANAGEDVVERPRRRVREPHAVGGDHRHVEGGGQVAERRVVGFFFAQQVALELDARIGRAKETDDAIDEAADAKPAAERGAADQGDQAAGPAVELLERQRPLPFRRAQFHLRDQAAEILVAGARLDEHGQREEP